MPPVLVTNIMTVYLLTLFYHVMYSKITCKTIMHLWSLSGALLHEWLIGQTSLLNLRFFCCICSLGHFFYSSTLYLCMFLLSARVQGRDTIYYDNW
jgi:hypothetical protein